MFYTHTHTNKDNASNDMQTQRGVDKSVNKKNVKSCQTKVVKWSHMQTHENRRPILKRRRKRDEQTEWKRMEKKRKRKKKELLRSRLYDQYFGNSFTSLNILYKHCYILT